MGDEDQISSIFAALKHPIRRKMLSILSQVEAMSFSDLMHSIKLVDTGTFGFHLSVLGALIEQNEGGKYRLSDLGKVAHQLITFIAESEEVESMKKEGSEKTKPLFQLLVEGTQDLEQLSFGYWTRISPNEKEKRKKILEYIQDKLDKVNKSEPKPICEIQVGVTSEGMITIGNEWLTELSLAEKKKYMDLLMDKLKFIKEEEN